MTTSAALAGKVSMSNASQRAAADLTGTAASQDRMNCARSRTRRRATRMALNTAASPKHT